MRLNEAVKLFVVDYFKNGGRAQKTMAAYSADLAQFIVFSGDSLSLDSLTTALITDWIEELRERHAPATVKRKVAALKLFCAHWVRRGKLRESPFWRLELRFEQTVKPLSPLTPRQERALLAHARKARLEAEIDCRGLTDARAARCVRARALRAARDLALVELLTVAGLRVGEMTALNVDDFDPEEASMKISGTGIRARIVYLLSQPSVEALGDYLDARRATKPRCRALFLSSSGRRLCTESVAQIVKRLGREAGIPGRVTPGTFRRTLECRLLRRRVDVRVVLAFLGKTALTAAARSEAVVGHDHYVGELRKAQPSLGL